MLIQLEHLLIDRQRVRSRYNRSNSIKSNSVTSPRLHTDVATRVYARMYVYICASRSIPVLQRAHVYLPLRRCPLARVKSSGRVADAVGKATFTLMCGFESCDFHFSPLAQKVLADCLALICARAVASGARGRPDNSACDRLYVQRNFV